MTGFQVESSTPATCANAACVKSNPPNKWSMHYRDIDLQECITNCNVLNVGGNCDFLTYTRNVSYWNCFLIRSISGDGGKQDIENGCAKQRAQQINGEGVCFADGGDFEKFPAVPFPDDTCAGKFIYTDCRLKSEFDGADHSWPSRQATTTGLDARPVVSPALQNCLSFCKDQECDNAPCAAFLLRGSCADLDEPNPNDASTCQGEAEYPICQCMASYQFTCDQIWIKQGVTMEEINDCTQWSHPSNGGSAGDPHLNFAKGGKADFRGEDGATFSFFSAPGIAINVKTEDATRFPSH